MYSIFVAFVLDAFMVEFSLSQGKFENALENKIKELGLGVSRYDNHNI